MKRLLLGLLLLNFKKVSYESFMFLIQTLKIMMQLYVSLFFHVSNRSYRVNEDIPC